ncbi:hypothetical protein [Actinomadura sp. DC4]|uniref:hypothetical protein n=1 Tax=Actinomadura sp. DC4 TaxID=3055069 RepID=UPI0025B0858E|nr:hypothetical protein [Actinomadura sp. DC4]MDN3357624.1 hypothetical protein [Actinomadura sp. DC4]
MHAAVASFGRIDILATIAQGAMGEMRYLEARSKDALTRNASQKWAKCGTPLLVFLAGESVGYINGQVIGVDGGKRLLV